MLICFTRAKTSILRVEELLLVNYQLVCMLVYILSEKNINIVYIRRQYLYTLNINIIQELIIQASHFF